MIREEYLMLVLQKHNTFYYAKAVKVHVGAFTILSFGIIGLRLISALFCY